MELASTRRGGSAQPQGDSRMAVAAEAPGHHDDIGPIEVGERLLDHLRAARPGDGTAVAADRQHPSAGDSAENPAEGLGLVGQDSVIGHDRHHEHVRPLLSSAVPCDRPTSSFWKSLAQSAQ